MRIFVVSIVVLVFIILPLTATAEPPGLSDAEMEQIYAKGIWIDGMQVGLTDSAVASDSSSAMDDVSDSTLQVGAGLNETGQNQLNNENATVAGGDSTVINLGGDNKEQVNLTKAVYVTEGAQTGNEGIIGNTAQGVFLQPVNAVTVRDSLVNSSISQHNTTTILMVNY